MILCLQNYCWGKLVNNIMIKKNILLIVTSDLFVRNYLTTDALSIIREKNNLSIIASSEITLKEKVELFEGFKGYFSFNPKLVRNHNRLFKVLMWKNRKRSSSFTFRYLRELGYQNIYGKKSFMQFVKGLVVMVYNNIIKDRWAIYSIVFGNKLLFNSFYRFFKHKLKISIPLLNTILSLKPDLVLLPSNAFDPIGNDVSRICKSLNIKSLFLIDNWDNLSSKTVFFFKPDFIGVWGEQSKEHAIKIHDFPSEDVFIIGTPRFDNYLNTKFEKLKSHFSFQYVLFVGCAIPFDETSALKKLDEEITNHHNIYNNLKVIYRPHPWRQNRIKEKPFIQSDFTNVIMDPQLSNAYFNRTENIEAGSGFQPDINYYPSLLKNAKFVIGPLTTMLIESLILKNPTLAFAYNDHVHFTSPHNALKYFIHFKNLESIQSLSFCKDLALFSSEFRRMYRMQSISANKSNGNIEINYYIDISAPHYSEKLDQLINKLIVKNK